MLEKDLVLSDVFSQNAMAAFQRLHRPVALRPLCDWPSCDRHRLVGPYCKRHARMHDSSCEPAPSPSVGSGGAARSQLKRALPQVHEPEARGGKATLDDFEDALVETFVLEGMTLQCPSCGAWNFPGERVRSGRSLRVTLCCKGGKLSHLPPLPDAPEPLRSWLRGSTTMSRNFRLHIRRYNSAMSFVSFGANLEVRTGGPANSAPPVCIIHGAVYHHSHPLHPATTEDAKLAQLYLYDPAEATALRVAKDQALNVDLLTQLASMLDAVDNPYVSAYRRMGELTKVGRTNMNQLLFARPKIFVNCKALWFLFHPVPEELAASVTWLLHLFAFHLVILFYLLSGVYAKLRQLPLR